MGGVLKALEQAMELDPVGTSVLMDLAVAELVADEVAANESWLAPAFTAHVLERTEVAKRALVRDYVGKALSGEYPDDQDAMQAAAWLGEVEVEVCKDFITYTLSDGRKVQQFRARDPYSGQFAAMPGRAAPVSVKGTDRDAISPHIINAGQVGEDESGARAFADGADIDALDRHQGQWQEANRFALDMVGQFNDVKGVYLDVTVTGSDGNPSHLQIPLGVVRRERGLPMLGQLNPVSDTIAEITVGVDEKAPESTRAMVENFNMSGRSTGSNRFSMLAGKGPDWWRQQGQGLSGWKADGSHMNESGMKLFSDRMTAASELLGALPGMEKQAKFVALAGQYGPMAEDVLGPHVRQAAYRYRGTETTPDRELTGAFGSKAYKQIVEAARSGADPASLAEVLDDAAKQSKTRGEGGQQDVVLASAGVRSRQGMSGDQLRLNLASDLAVRHLMGRLPEDPFTAKLSEAAGHVLPSQGVVINAEGKIVSQAVGFADDHYLPFDLKNLVGLRGGQYVRTRVNGGLTGEDVYASVQTGARMATVVSPAGVFTLEFAPDFRGARGNSDKARSMYTRYLKILDAVEGSGLYVQPLPLAERRKVDAQVEAAMALAGEDGDRKALTAEYTKRRMRELESGIDVDELQGRAEEAALNERGFANMSRPAQARRVEDLYEEMLAEATDEIAQPLRLNAAGYEVALKTLQQQFPYFIRNVSYEPLKTERGDKGKAGFLERRGQDTTLGMKQRTRSTDSGYVRPGGLRPGSVNAGFRSTGRLSPLPYPGVGEKTSEGAPEKGPAVQGGGAGPAPGGAVAAASPGAPSAAATPMDATLAAQQDMGRRNATQVSLSLRPVQALGGHLELDVRDELKALGSIENALEDPNSTRLWAAVYPEDLPKLIADPRGAAALSDKTKVQRTVSDVLTNALAVVEEVEPGFMAESFEGAANPRAATAWIADRIVSAASVTQGPFETAQVTSPFHRGPKPLRMPEMMQANSPETLAGLEGGAGAPAAKLIGVLGKDPDAAIVAHLEVLEGIEPVMEAAKHHPLAANPDDYPKALASLMGVEPKQLEAALGQPLVTTMVPTLPQLIAQRAQLLQQARTLMAVRSVIGGGGAGPKAPATFGKASSSRPGVSVLPPEHPLVATVMLRKAAGKPLV
jgi:hypothetical protein